MKKYAFAAIALTCFTVPAVAAEYYVVRDPDTKKCTVVEEKPVDTKITVLGNKVFESRDEAESQVSVVCRDEEPDSGGVVIKKDSY